MKRAYFNYPKLWDRVPSVQPVIVPIRMQNLIRNLWETVYRDLQDLP